MFSNENLTSAAYLYLIMGSLVAIAGLLMVYFDKRGKFKNKRK